MRKLLLLAVPFLLGATTLGTLLQFDKRYATGTSTAAILGTCDAFREGSVARMLGGVSETATKLCICGSDGAGTPAYAWCSLTIANTAALVCAGGSATVCP